MESAADLFGCETKHGELFCHLTRNQVEPVRKDVSCLVLHFLYIANDLLIFQMLFFQALVMILNDQSCKSEMVCVFFFNHSI